ncbi:sporulation protein YjcZ [Bacillus cereus]|uniref:Sporulation protein YjcZ n=1 Tax=Bacillus cereus TaxID=1396 RepID=A0A9X6VNF8_BACCE|nr:sporulation protein YjcZ [Bacillus cereus]PFC09945.1 sporulation protein YjcZ [Bacillus cereus]PFD23112.1 sporulation protein YjcZ [Bacillus cereus]PFL58348.1 sporulation protein YjcZ [Bacillus cereus]PGW64115.1 sporulation protein YjcZ [Bacillus cereus]
MNPSFILLSKGGTIIMGYGDSCGEGCGFAGGFALLVVLFILLIIIGCSCFC